MVARMATFRERLKLLREEKGLSQKALGKLLNLSQSAIAYYETGDKEPTQETLHRLADYFGVSVDYLLGRTDIREMPGVGTDELELDEILRKENVLFEGVPLTAEEKRSVLDFLRLADRIAEQRLRSSKDRSKN